jgi:aspartate/methionine/tyrosine aminotransferase
MLEPGDEVCVFEPFFELYLKQFEQRGANVKFVPLAATTEGRWKVDVNVSLDMCFISVC